MESAVRRTSSISGQVRTSTSSRWRWRQAGVAGMSMASDPASPAASEPGTSAGRASTNGCRRDAVIGSFQVHAVIAVDLGHVDADDLLARRWDVLADMVGADRELAVAAVDEDRQTNGAWPSEVHQRIHRRPDRSTRVQHVVDEDD